jgi:AraC-like DNA-binding protein
MSFFSPNNTFPTVCGTTDFSGLLHTVVPASGCTLLLCTAGCALGSSHFQPVAIRRGMLVPLFAFSRFTIEHVSSRFSCRFVEMSDPAIADFTVNFNSPVFWDFLYQHPVLTLENPEWRLVNEWFGRMEWITQTFEDEICQQMVYGELHNLFIAIEQRIVQLFPLEVHDEKSAVWSIPDRLNALLNQHIHHERSVKFYASELCLNPDYLNKVCHRLMKTSTKALINDAVIYELKHYLAETDLTVEQIAAQMNYDNVSYLCRFFRNATGQSMMEFRRKQR